MRDDDYQVIENFIDVAALHPVTKITPRHKIDQVHLEDSFKKIAQLIKEGISPNDIYCGEKSLNEKILTPEMRRKQTISHDLIVKGEKLRTILRNQGEVFDGEVIGSQSYLVLIDPKEKKRIRANSEIIKLLQASYRFSKPFMVKATPIITIDGNNKVIDYAWNIKNIDDIDMSSKGIGYDVYHEIIGAMNTPKQQPRLSSLAAE